MQKFGGITLDWYDDRGDTLKQMFPTKESLPGVIKTASIRPKEKLANEQFALIAVDSGNVLRKYACNDAGTTAMSAIYFMEHGQKLPIEAQKVAAVNLVDACLRFKITPPTPLLKLAVPAALLGGLAGGALGAGAGAAGAGEGNRLTGAVTGGLLGAGAGALGHHALMHGTGAGKRLTEIQGKVQGVMSKAMKAKKPDLVAAAERASKYQAAPGDVALVGAGQLGGAAATGAAAYGAGSLAGKIAPQQSQPKTVYASADEGGRAPTEAEKEEIKNWIRTNDNPSDEMFHSFLESKGINPHLGEAVVYDFAHESTKSASVVDITGKHAPMQIKTAEPTTDSDYAVILPDGSKHYPINTWDRVKTAEQYYLDEGKRMQPEIRRQFATKLATKAGIIGYPLEADIFEAGATTYASDGHLKAALEMRKVACAPDGEEREFLDGLFEKRAEIDPNVYAEVLRRFDVNQGLDSGWDRVVIDPWSSTFGINKTAEVVWEQGNERVMDRSLQNLANNRLDLVTKQFGFSFAGEFRKDPIGIFNSLPLPEKRIMSRLANDVDSSGETEAPITL